MPRHFNAGPLPTLPLSPPGLSIFLSQQLDVVVLEVGIGGRLDATNSGWRKRRGGRAPPAPKTVLVLVSAATNIAVRHRQTASRPLRRDPAQ